MARKNNIKKIPNHNSPRRYVTEGVTLKCAFGSQTVKLKTPGRKTASSKWQDDDWPKFKTLII